ncbi:hypothetical protein K431DRAFT_290001 [Polychaeton citri CBS 116435]|uniref:Uncharacterized protein n=1 Tax=Polychaeton citri CBS 116435 TaxID=1314669 RepID=A0A9P4QF53_9PEZI|nr:hypothetical protein K431DRAFT_290001 [Polychaeton citri CBS 116435]
MSEIEIQVYETRLREYLQVLKSLSFEAYSQDWKPRLDAKSVEEWAVDISDITVPEAKHMLGGDVAPSAEERMSRLPDPASDPRPGVYSECVLTPGDEDDTWSYVGVATAVTNGSGLSRRVGEHLNPKYRADQQKRQRCTHYDVVEEPGMNRRQVFGTLAVGEFASGEPDDINEMRALCHVAEQIYTAWLGSYKASTMRREKFLRRMTPWKSDLLGMNSSIVVKQPMKVENRAIPLDPVLYKKVRNERSKLARREYDGDQKIGRDAYNSWYQRTVANPVAKMKRAKASKEEIKAFQKLTIGKWEGLKDAELAKFRDNPPKPKSTKPKAEGSKQSAGKKRALDELTGNASPESSQSRKKGKKAAKSGKLASE